MMRGERWGLRLALVLCTAATGLLPAARAGAVDLVLPASALGGFHSVRAGGQAAVADLASGLPRSLAAAVARAEVQVSALSSRSSRLRSDAFVFASAQAAGRVLAAWARLHRAQSAPVGGGGDEAARGRAVMVAWRDGSRIGVIVLTRRRGGTPAAQVVEDAVLADVWLRSLIPTTAWGKVLDQIRPDGSVSKRVAEEAFVLAYGPLPGVRAPSGRQVGIPSGSLAAQWVLRYLKQLSPRQQRVVTRKLGVAPSGHGAHIADLYDPGFTPTAAIQNLVNPYISKYESLLGHTLALTVIAGVTTTVVKTGKGGDALADALPLNSEGVWGSGTPVTCRIRYTPAGLKQTPEFQQLMAAHELFHCFQFDIRGTGAWNMPAAWVTEGSADWAALSVDPVPWDVGGGNLQNYLFTSDHALFERDYDAVGFWGHAADTFDLWGAMTGILTANSNEAAFHLAAGDTDGFLTSWGSSVVRAATAGPPWQMQSPIAPPTFAQLHEPAEFLTPAGIPDAVEAVPYTTSQYFVTVPGDRPVLHVSIDGHARLGLQTNYTDLQSAWFCVSAEPCVCPPDTTGQVPPTLPLANKTALALSGDPGSGTAGVLTSYSLETFCTPVKTPLSNPAIDNGDPYMSTFDGGRYGFQTAGEFALVKSTSDNLEIQSRQVPYKFVLGAQWGDSLAMNTAFAMRDGGAVVEVDKGSPLILYIDKQRRRAHAGETIALSGGGSVLYTPHQVTVRWPDGTTATVLSIGSEGVNLAVALSGDRAGHVRGLFGADDGHVRDDYVGRNGKRYSVKMIESAGLIAWTPAEARVMLSGFGASWRITQRESLFVYPPGKSTRSYLVPGFPRALMSLQALTAARRAAAALACHRSGVTNGALLIGCEIDFGATGDHRLATATGQVQRAAGIKGGSAGGLTGTWTGRYSGAFQGTFDLTWQQSGSSLRGVIHLNPGGTQQITGTVSGSAIHFGTVGSAAAITYTGTVSGNTMSGTYSTPRGGGSWSASR